MSLAELCALLTNIFEKLNKLIINSDANLRPPKQELFVTLVNAVNYCHKEIYYRCCRGTPLKLVNLKSFKTNNSKIMSKATKI